MISLVNDTVHIIDYIDGAGKKAYHSPRSVPVTEHQTVQGD